MSLGWRRGLIDLYCFVLYNNALTENRAAETADQARRRTGTSPRLMVAGSNRRT